MLIILFRLNDDCYALDCANVLEILPFGGIRRKLRPPPGIAGLLSHRGMLVPVLDLSELLIGRPALPRLSTRIILACHSADNGLPRTFGLIAERVMQTMQCTPTDFISSGVVNEDAPYLGPVLMASCGLVQRLEVDGLVPMSMYSSPAGAQVSPSP
jgi:chemotaxis-related protein WspB